MIWNYAMRTDIYLVCAGMIGENIRRLLQVSDECMCVCMFAGVIPIRQPIVKQFQIHDSRLRSISYSINTFVGQQTVNAKMRE